MSTITPTTLYESPQPKVTRRWAACMVLGALLFFGAGLSDGALALTHSHSIIPIYVAAGGGVLFTLGANRYLAAHTYKHTARITCALALMFLSLCAGAYFNEIAPHNRLTTALTITCTAVAFTSLLFLSIQLGYDHLKRKKELNDQDAEPNWAAVADLKYE